MTPQSSRKASACSAKLLDNRWGNAMPTNASRCGRSILISCPACWRIPSTGSLYATAANLCPCHLTASTPRLGTRALVITFVPFLNVPIHRPTCIAVDNELHKSDASLVFSTGVMSKKQFITVLTPRVPHNTSVVERNTCLTGENRTCHHSSTNLDQNTNFMPCCRKNNATGRCFIDHCLSFLKFEEVASIKLKYTS